MITTKNDFKRIEKGLKQIKEFKDIPFKESWCYDVWRLEEEIKEKQKFLRVVKRERKLQPKVDVISAITKEKQTINNYQIGITSDGLNIIYCKDW